jgi:hypothetical protein
VLNGKNVIRKTQTFDSIGDTGKIRSSGRELGSSGDRRLGRLRRFGIYGNLNIDQNGTLDLHATDNSRTGDAKPLAAGQTGRSTRSRSREFDEFGAVATAQTHIGHRGRHPTTGRMRQTPSAIADVGARDDTLQL